MSRIRSIATAATSFGMAIVLCSLFGLSAAQAVDRSALSPRTQIVGGFWDGVRPLLDVQNPADQPEFYEAPEGVDVSALAPGTVLRERTFKYYVATMETSLDVTQLLYVTTSALGVLETNVTSVIHPPQGTDGSIVAYQSFYDTSNPVDNPSRSIAGNLSLGGLIPALENVFILPALLAGHSVVVADTQGKDANFAAGPAYGAATLDSLRAATAATTTEIKPDSNIGLFGYSGGAIASNWAAIRAREYAPEIEQRLIGVAQGGLMVNPINNLDYASDGLVWSGVVGLALSSLGDTYQVDISQYLNEYGLAAYADTRNLSIIEAQYRYPSLKWTDIAKPEYPNLNEIPELKKIIDTLNMGAWDSPKIPMFIFQGAGGEKEGTPVHPEVGMGDGIMVTKDVRTLARQYCAAGTAIEYREYQPLSHFLTALLWATEGYAWLESKFHGAAATNNCQTIPEGNTL